MRRAGFALAALLVASATACATTPETDPRYGPTESVLEVVAVLRRHIPDDTYRFEPARDFTGRNVYRASLLRLENLESAHADALRAGHLDEVIAFAKGRSLERLRAYDAAAAQYRIAAASKGELEHEALRSAAICDGLAEALTLEARPEGETPLTRDRVMERLDAREALLEAMLKDSEGSHYAAVINEEIERTDLARASFLVDSRRLSTDGDVIALGAMQHLVVAHRESKNANAHLLALADLYASLSMEYVDRHPPESLQFDPPRFEELVESAARLYQAVSNQDGAPEKLEAQRRLEAFLAFTLRVDRDRFSP